MKIYENFVNNRFDEEVGAFIDVINPAQGKICARVTLATGARVVEAVNAAALAQKSWRALSGVQRAGYLRALAEALQQRGEKIAGALSLETGKSSSDALAEVAYAAEVTVYHAEWARRIEGEILPSDNQRENLLLQRDAIGVIACLIPFNFPVYTLLRKIAPALIAGNTVVVRPSNQTPCSALEIAQAVLDAGLPPGVVNILAMSHETAERLCTDARVGMITMTGSVSAGRHVLEYSKANIAKVSLELGGKTPAIVAADADLLSAALAIARSKTSNCGQLCTAVERVYVERSVYPQMLTLLRDSLAAWRSGDRAVDPDLMGPLISDAARQRVHQMVERAVAAGARIELGGEVPDGPGYFYPVTLLSNVAQDDEIVQEEVFGPVLCILPCDDMQHALRLANDHQFGLASVLFTEDYRTTMLFANEIEAGELYINRAPGDPYQGYHAGWKRSGVGGDDGKHGMLEFTQTRLVITPY